MSQNDAPLGTLTPGTPGFYHEPARAIPIYRQTDVLVVGGGPAGCAAATAAARCGAEVVLVERFGHLGGLATGGLVIWIDRMTDWDGRPVIAGFASEIIDRLPQEALIGPPRAAWGNRDPQLAAYWHERAAAWHGVVTWSPTVDPEYLKLAHLDLVLESKASLLLHAWAAAAIVKDGRMRGVVFESKEGRQAILARVVIDATGDGDIFARAGAGFDTDIDETTIHHRMNVAWLWCGVDMQRWLQFKQLEPEAYAQFLEQGRAALGWIERPHVAWRDDVALFMGPKLSGYSPLRLADLTAVEIESRRRMLAHLDYFRRHAPGFEKAWIMLTAPQIGTRHARRLVGLKRIRQSDWKSGLRQLDEIGVSPSASPSLPSISVPLGSLVARDVENLVAAGRNISCDPQSHLFMREIPQCWMTGQAAGVAAALAAASDTCVKGISVDAVRDELRRQGAYLPPPGDPTPGPAPVQ
jgi:hypothetical protein